MRKLTFISLIAVLTGSPFFSSAQVEKPTWPKDRVIEENYYTIGTQAYIYSVAPFMMYAALYQGQNIPYEGYPKGVPMNSWTMVNKLANVKNSRTVMANVNTLYASAWLDLRKEPVLIDIPPFGDRYYSLGLQDAYENYFRILGSRTIGGLGGKFIICGEDYSGPVPDGYTKVTSPTPLIWMLMRIAPKFDNDQEVEQCRKLQAQVSITPLSQLNKADYDPASYNTKLDLGSPDVSKDPLRYFEIAHQYLRLNKVPKGEEALMELFRQIGFNPDQDFSVAKLSEPQRKGLLRAIEAGKEMINTYITQGENILNGWTIQSKDMGNYGYSYLTRAALTMQSIGGFPWEEAIYVVAYKDVKGGELDGGTNDYVLHFNKNELPQVYQFWSVTMYELPSVMLYDNQINRYQMGPQIEKMTYNKDGSLDIYIQHDQPKEAVRQANWLPAPKGKFVLSLRMYNPKPDMFQLDVHKVPLPGITPLQKNR